MQNRDWPVLGTGAAIGLALIFLFHGGLANLWFRWGFQQELSHSYFIPLITLWMLWERRDAMANSMGRSNPAALGLFAVGVFMVFALKQLHVFMLEHVGLLIAIFALPLLVGGTSLLRVTAVPLAYLVFMIPPPFWVITVTSWEFQLWSSQLGVAMIRLFDVPVFLSGNVIELGDVKLAVVEACSGLRYLFPFLSLGALAAYFYKGPLWQRALVLFSTIPITILMNSFRIAVTGVLSDRYGSQHTEGLLHFFEGWVVFVMCIALLLAILVVMARLTGRKNVLAGLGLPDVQPIAPSAPWERERFVKLGAAGAVMLAVGAFAVHSMDVTLKTPERRVFAELPLEFADWRVEPRALDVATERTLAADDYIVADMTNTDGEVYNLYTAYLEQQRNGSSWHSPAQCLPGGGWQFIENAIVPAAGEGAPDYHINRIVMKKGQTQFLVYYWYQQRGHRIANEFMMKIMLIWDVITQQRSDGAMIRLMTPISSDESIAEADARLQGFQRQIEAKMDAYIPQ